MWLTEIKRAGIIDYAGVGSRNRQNFELVHINGHYKISGRRLEIITMVGLWMVIQVCSTPLCMVQWTHLITTAHLYNRGSSMQVNSLHFGANDISLHQQCTDFLHSNTQINCFFMNRVGVNSIPELELQLNSNSNSGIGIGIGIEIGGIENGIGIETPGIGIGIGIENRNWIFCNCYHSTY